MNSSENKETEPVSTYNVMSKMYSAITYVFKLIYNYFK